MEEIKSGIAFHCHHEMLFEFVYDYDERARCIKKNKPLEEQELRLKLFQLITNDLLPGKDSSEWTAYEKAGTAYEKAWVAYTKTSKAYTKACVAYEKAWVAYKKAWVAYKKAWVAYTKTSKAYEKAGTAYDKAYGREIEKLHKQLCPDCPWDGKTIFTRKDKDGNWY